MSDDIADRLAIRELVDAYAHSADRRDPQAQAALFTEDAVVTIRDRAPEPQILRGREQLAAAFDELRNYDKTTHFNGQNMVTIDGDRATGEMYCLAHHVRAERASEP